MLVLVLFSTVVTTVLVYIYLTWNNDYWKKRNVPYLQPTALFGNAGNMLIGETLFPVVLKGYDKFQNYLYFGFFKFIQPGIIIRDSKLIETIQVKEFSSFHDNDIDIDEHLDPYFGKNPFVLKGDKWKVVRNHVIQQFSVGKMKRMFPLMVQASENFINYLSDEIDASRGSCLSAKDICAKFTTDSVIQCAFSIDAKSFTESKIREIGQKILEPGFFGTLRVTIVFFFPNLAKKLNIRIVTPEVPNFFANLIRELLQYRKENNISENDFLDAMIRLREKNIDYDFNEEHMVANVLTFFTDGVETSSVLLSFLLYELGSNNEVLKKLRKEIDETLAKNGGKISYDGIQQMKYLDCVLSEILRMYPTLGFIPKICTKDFVLPHPKGYNEGPGVLIKKGTPVIIPPWSIHRDPRYFAEPNKFDPDRFSDNRKFTIEPSAYMPFGLGPRTCLGQRFAVTQIKIAVANIVSSFDIKVNEKTVTPLELDFQSVLTAVKGGLWLNFYKRKPI